MSTQPVGTGKTGSFLAARTRLAHIQEAGLLGVIALLGIALTVFGGSVFDPRAGHEVNNFFRTSNLLGGVATPMSTYAIMAVGVTIVIIAGGIDISVGSVFALAALGVVAALQNLPAGATAALTVPLAFIVASGIGLSCGLLNGAIVVGLRMHPFIVTLGTMSIFRGLCNVLVRLKTLPSPGKSLPASFTERFMAWEPFPGLLPAPMIVMLVCVMLGWIYLSFLVAGRETYAVGGNEEAARFSGLPVGRIKMRVYALSGLSAGLAGWVFAGYYQSASSDTGLGWELQVVAAAVVGGASLTGGRGTALGALLGTLVIKLIENGIFIMRYDQQFSTIIVGVAIIVAVAIDRLTEAVRTR
ncbi:MAG: ABC transporter permease [Tepidisphaeraceae bacterium]